jgi:hypothetical protein
MKSAETIDLCLPIDYNRGLATRNICIGFLLLSLLTGLTAIIVPLAAFHQKAPWYFSLKSTTVEIIVLASNVVITLLNESMGYIHTASLRWSLQQEGRLSFNSNLRLFSSSRLTAVNKWYTNALLVVCAILTYSTPSLTYLHLGDSDVGDYTGDDTIINRAAVVCLGIGITGQAAISILALFSTHIPTWSSNPVNTVKACLLMGTLEHRPNRCMRGVKDANKPSTFKCATGSHPSMIISHKEVKRIFGLAWCIIILGIVWGVVVKALADNLENVALAGGSWAVTPKTQGDWASEWSPYVNLRLYSAAKDQYMAGFLAIVLISGLQAVLTIGLHCIELLVNLHRDEVFWRTATSAEGCQCSSYDSILAACKSWPTVLLFVGKAVIHWLFGLSLTAYYERDVEWWKVEAKLRPFLRFRPVQIFYMTGALVVISCMASFLAFKRPQGAQPTTFGHLQTLADLIDEWPEGEDFFWGHKSEAVRGCYFHAGTSRRRLQDVFWDQLYK